MSGKRGRWYIVVRWRDSHGENERHFVGVRDALVIESAVDLLENLYASQVRRLQVILWERRGATQCVHFGASGDAREVMQVIEGHLLSRAPTAPTGLKYPATPS